jgi:hypothetical protein
MPRAVSRIPGPPALSAAHQRRLREVWRSAGWPFQDLIEVELLDAGLLQRERDREGRDSLRVSDAGIAVLAATLRRNRAARDAHEALVARVAREMQRAGRLVWRGLSLRAPIDAPPGKAPESPQQADNLDIDGASLKEPGTQRPRWEGTITQRPRWVVAMPDVFSIRHTTVEDYVEPIVHEVKVRRADLLSDLRHEAKRQAYLGMASQCWYVLKAGIGSAEEIPPECGVMLAHGADFAALEVLRPAPKRAMRLSLGTWMALAKATAEAPLDDAAQALLHDPSQTPLEAAPQALRDDVAAAVSPCAPESGPLVDAALPNPAAPRS